jgi:hypothetical protein
MAKLDFEQRKFSRAQAWYYKIKKTKKIKILFCYKKSRHAHWDFEVAVFLQAQGFQNNGECRLGWY